MAEESGKEREEGGAAERSETEEIPDLSPALYLVERLEDADEELLKKAVCRRFSMPWTIAETKRLLIREFKASDVLPDEEGGISDARASVLLHCLPVPVL